MYCVNCGVELKDSEKCCPLCSTPVFHPDIKQGDGEKPYPEFYPADRKQIKRIVMLVVTVLCCLGAGLPLIIDLRLGGGVTWSGYVLGGIALVYIALILPFWFKRPNPVIFVPCTFVAITLYLLLISLTTNGGWFLSFGFPVTAIAGVIVTAVVVLCKYVRAGYFFISGGAVIAVGGYTVLIEMFLWITFGVKFVFWSLYPLICCLAIGILLIVIGACKPMREALRRKFFI